MIPINLEGKIAVVAGVANDESFAWFIAKALQAAGARIVLASHPRMMNIVHGCLTYDTYTESRKLPYGGGEFKPEKVLPMDASYDTMADVPEAVRTDRKMSKFPEFSIHGTIQAIGQEFGGIDILIHSMAFSREIKNKMIETSRAAYLEALGISSYSLTSMLRAAEPYMTNRPGGAAALALTYLGGDRVVPHYGGGMSTSKAALQLDAQQLAHNLGGKNIRVNLISAGPYASLAAKGIGDIQQMIDYAAQRSPLPRGVTAEEVANTAAFLCSPLASGITGHVLYVDCGYNVMGV